MTFHFLKTKCNDFPAMCRNTSIYIQNTEENLLFFYIFITVNRIKNVRFISHVYEMFISFFRHIIDKNIPTKYAII